MGVLEAVNASKGLQRQPSRLTTSAEGVSIAPRRPLTRTLEMTAAVVNVSGMIRNRADTTTIVAVEVLMTSVVPSVPPIVPRKWVGKIKAHGRKPQNVSVVIVVARRTT